MITDGLIRKKFVSETLKEGINKIYSTQQQVFQSNFNSRTGRMKTFLSSHSYESQLTGESVKIFVRILPYLRFLDMSYRERNDRIAKSKRRSIAIYNRVVWGVLYHETFPELQYGFTDEVRKSIRQELESIFNRK
jgi:hypothetical protein